MSDLRSYSKIYNVGHRVVSTIFSGEVQVEEKIDGSQFSFGRFGGELKVRSKGVQIDPFNPEGMFLKAIEYVECLPLVDGMKYVAEFLSKPKHNKLKYDSVPRNNLVLLDCCALDRFNAEVFLPYRKREKEAERLGVDCAPLLYEGEISSHEMLNNLMDHESFLGGPKMEGIVIKNYDLRCPDGKIMMAKYVSETFREVMKVKESKGSFIDVLSASYRTEARWDKAFQRLRDNGKLDGTPRDIGALVKEARADILEEDGEEIREQVYNWAIKRVLSESTKGLAEWYKAKLAEEAFS